NPVAGRGKAISVAPKLLKELAARGITATTLYTTEEARNDMLDHSILDSDIVIAMGGDGTLNRVARPILLSSQNNAERLPSVAFVALGTGNVAVRAFHLPQRLSDVANLIASGTTRSIDAGIVFQNGVAIAVFLLWLGAGLDGAMIHAVDAIRSHYRGSWLIPRYFLEAPRTLMTYKFPKINVQSKQINGNFASVMIANVGLLGIGSITRFANPYDGQFDLIATSPRNRLAWFLSALLAGIHGYDFCFGVSRSRETDVTLQSQESVPAQIDGEPLGPPPFAIKIRHSALALLMPTGQG
ncbi:MAG: hypothetical protein HY037_06485, partial [Nitrospirae bacterium]|nr:hypothetical protein [Candidatus Troglogloeales bacterium]